MKEFKEISQKGRYFRQRRFHSFSTYGFPLEITVEMAKEKNIKIDT